MAQEPGSLSYTAKVLAASASCETYFQNSKNFTDKELQHYLFGVSAKSERRSADSHIPTILLEPKQPPRNCASKNREFQDYWRPTAVSWWFMTMGVFLPAAVIAAMEELQRLSKRGNGIASLTISQSLASQVITIIPALIVTLISSVFQALAFGVATLQPYVRICSANGGSRRLFERNFAGQLSFINLWQGLKLRISALALSSLATIIAVTLPVVISGIYRIEPNSHFWPIDALQLDTLQLNESAISPIQLSDGGAGLTFGLMEQNNLSSPKFTYEDLVFPTVSVSDRDIYSRGNPDRIELYYPAARSSLQCFFIPPAAYNAPVYSSIPNNDTPANWLMNLTATFELSSTCQYDDVIAYFAIPEAQAVFGGFSGSIESAPTCPSIVFTFGLFTLNATFPANVTSMICSFDVEQVFANVSFSLPDFTIEPSDPPVPDESSSNVVLTNPLWPVTTLWSLNLPAWPQLSYQNPSSDAYGQWLSSPSLDSFHQALILGPDGIPAEQLLGSANRDTYYNAIRRQFSRYMAQLMNANIRSTVSGSETQQVLNVTLVTSGEWKIVQHEPSKIVLQALLGSMLLLMTLAYVDMLVTGRNSISMRSVLPHNPNSIAGMMSLLASSSSLDVLKDADSHRNKDNVRVRLDLWSKDELEKSQVLTDTAKGNVRTEHRSLLQSDSEAAVE